jgi:acyl-CoA synthetase (AMP-forming)/AMP-acid ligase II
METGGFKGSGRDMPRDVLYHEIETRLGVPPDRIVNQYGMTELASQFYDSVLLEKLSPRSVGPRRKLGPPWARVRIVDPETGRDAEPGEVGMIVIHDLANTGSIAALESADLGRVVASGNAGEDGFEVLGRDPDAEERGCSIAADALFQGEP